MVSASNSELTRRIESIWPLEPLDIRILRLLLQLQRSKGKRSSGVDFELGELWDALELPCDSTTYSALFESLKRLHGTTVAYYRNPAKPHFSRAHGILDTVTAHFPEEAGGDGVVRVEFSAAFLEEPDDVLDLLEVEISV